MKALDEELRRRSGGKYSLDDVAGQLAADGSPVSLERLRSIAAGLAGGPVESLSPQALGLN